MAQFNFKSFETHLGDILNGEPPRRFSPVYLIYGDSWLCKTAFERLLDAMLPETERKFGYESIDGANANIAVAVEHLNTFSFFSELKVVALQDARVFDTRQDQSRILQKAKTAWIGNEPKKSAKHLTNLLSLLNLSFEDIRADARRQLEGGDDEADDSWLDPAIQYCIDNRIRIPAAGDHAGMLEKALERGFPERHHLIIVSDHADKRRSLFKTIDRCGTTIDCSVPQGNRRADKMAQEAVLSERMNAILAKSGKRMEPQAFNFLHEMTGFDLGTFVNNLKKLVLYVGGRKTITAEDVRQTVRSTRKHPVFELTNAVLDKNPDEALGCLDAMLQDNIYPLQIFAALINQVRKLMLVKAFAVSDRGRVWHAGMAYGPFQKQVMPEIQACDAALKRQWEQWDDKLKKTGRSDETALSKPKGSTKSKPVSDLMIAQNPRNAYPVYLLFKRADTYSEKELVQLMQELGKADIKFKTTGLNPKLILEEIIFRICNGDHADVRAVTVTP